MGVSKEPPVSVSRFPETGGGWVIGGNSGNDAALSLCFNVRVVGHEVNWETLLVGRTLFVEIPSNVLPVGSKERLLLQRSLKGFVHLLDNFPTNRLAVSQTDWTSQLAGTKCLNVACTVEQLFVQNFLSDILASCPKIIQSVNCLLHCRLTTR